MAPIPRAHVTKKVKGQIVIKTKHAQSLLSPSSTKAKHIKVLTNNNHPTGPKHK